MKWAGCSEGLRGSGGSPPPHAWAAGGKAEIMHTGRSWPACLPACLSAGSGPAAPLLTNVSMSRRTRAAPKRRVAGEGAEAPGTGCAGTDVTGGFPKQRVHFDMQRVILLLGETLRKSSLANSILETLKELCCNSSMVYRARSSAVSPRW